MILASASGNRFAYVWEDEAPPTFDGAAWARSLCPADTGLGLDGLFLLHSASDGVWRMEHWDLDGSCTFCGNGTRAALALPGAPEGPLVEVQSSGQRVALRRDPAGSVALRMPAGAGFGFQASPLSLPHPHACAWIGNPQLIVEVPSVDAVDLKAFAPPLRHHPAFPQGTNVCILEVQSPGRARIRSWERGVEGETLSCGTGTAVAGAWMARRTGLPFWEFHPAGSDPLRVETVVSGEGDWAELWISGRIRVLGEFRPDPRWILSGS